MLAGGNRPWRYQVGDVKLPGSAGCRLGHRQVRRVGKSVQGQDQVGPEASAKNRRIKAGRFPRENQAAEKVGRCPGRRGQGRREPTSGPPLDAGQATARHPGFGGKPPA